MRSNSVFSALLLRRLRASRRPLLFLGRLAVVDSLLLRLSMRVGGGERRLSGSSPLGLRYFSHSQFSRKGGRGEVSFVFHSSRSVQRKSKERDSLISPTFFPRYRPIFVFCPPSPFTPNLNCGRTSPYSCGSCWLIFGGARDRFLSQSTFPLFGHFQTSGGALWISRGEAIRCPPKQPSRAHETGARAALKITAHLCSAAAALRRECETVWFVRAANETLLVDFCAHTLIYIPLDARESGAQDDVLIALQIIRGEEDGRPKCAFWV